MWQTFSKLPVLHSPAVVGMNSSSIYFRHTLSPSGYLKKRKGETTHCGIFMSAVTKERRTKASGGRRVLRETLPRTSKSTRVVEKKINELYIYAKSFAKSL